MAGLKIIVMPSAYTDVDKITDFLAEYRSPQISIRFINSFYKSLDVLETAPEIGTPSQKMIGVRRKMIDKYNALYYEQIGESIYILRIIDTRSNPDTTPY